jgi:hypothetical protein
VSCDDGFEWFDETISHALMPVTLDTRHTGEFRARTTEVGLGVVWLSACSYSPMLVRRTLAHVRRGDPEQFLLALVTRGAIRSSQRDGESVVAGALVMTDTSRPMESEVVCADGEVEAVALQIPRANLLLGSDRVDRLLAREIRAREGSAAILAGFLGPVPVPRTSR